MEAESDREQMQSNQNIMGDERMVKSTIITTLRMDVWICMTVPLVLET
jgi:hypothetical protein